MKRFQLEILVRRRKLKSLLCECCGKCIVQMSRRMNQSKPQNIESDFDENMMRERLHSGQVVSELAFYSDNLSLNLAEVNSFYLPRMFQVLCPMDQGFTKRGI